MSLLYWTLVFSKFAIAMNISVIVPVYNAEKTLTACINGLALQDYDQGHVEWIFVDNRSTDDSVSLLQKAPGVTLLSEDQRGAYAARNAGIAVASGDILAFLDPDCVPEPSWLRSMAETLQRPGVSVVLGVRRPSPDVGLNRMLGDYDTTRDEWAVGSNEREKYFGYTNNMGITRLSWTRFGPFAGRSRGSDTIFVRRVVDSEGCGAVVFAPAMKVSHLEMNGVVTYVRKAFTYGRSLQSYCRVVPVKPLSFRDRLSVFRKTVNSKSYGLARIMTLALLLAVGMLAWVMGRMAGKITRS